MASYFLRGKNFQVLDWVFGKLAVFLLRFISLLFFHHDLQVMDFDLKTTKILSKFKNGQKPILCEVQIK